MRAGVTTPNTDCLVTARPRAPACTAQKHLKQEHRAMACTDDDAGSQYPPSGWEITRRDALQAAAGAAAFATTLTSSSAPATEARRDGVPGYTVNLIVNGRSHVLTVDPRQSLLDVLRERLDLNGTKKGCNAGAC